MAKRAFDLFFSVAGLLVLSPLFLLLAVLVKVSDGGPLLFRQQRVGKDGKPFQIVKFRSMVMNAERLGLSVTRDGDPRVTAIGRLLRKYKLDELPQLWNVLVGEMSFVGPRPEVPRYVNQYTEGQRRVLALKPGITDLATLEFRNEEELLRRRAEGRQGRKAETLKAESGKQIAESGRLKAESGNEESGAETEKFYMEYCVPRKIELNLAYARTANVWEDTKIILRTLMPAGKVGRGAEDGGRRTVISDQ